MGIFGNIIGAIIDDITGDKKVADMILDRPLKEKAQLQEKFQKHYNKDEYHKAFEYLKQYLAKGGYVHYYRELGYMYENGYGTTKDYNKAMQCYQKAEAWREIGYMHYFP